MLAGVFVVRQGFLAYCSRGVLDSPQAIEVSEYGIC